jgi:hypothetical protein
VGPITDQKLVLGIFLGVKDGRLERLTSLPSVSRQSRKGGSFDVSTLWASMASYKDSFCFACEQQENSGASFIYFDFRYDRAHSFKYTINILGIES